MRRGGGTAHPARLPRAVGCIIDGGAGRSAGPASGAVAASPGRRAGQPCPSHFAFFSESCPQDRQWAPSQQRVCTRAPDTDGDKPSKQQLHRDRSRPAGAMRALTGPRAHGAPRASPARLLLFLCLLATTRPSLADGDLPDSAFTSLPVREEMMAKYSNFPVESHNISLTERSSTPVEKNITLEKPANMELTCQFRTSGDLNSVNVTWKKGEEQLESNYLVNTTGNTLYTQYMFTIINSKQMGSYSCLFEEETEQRGTFNIKVPALHGKNKPLITYVGDSTVLMCKCQDCHPLNWTWYSGNGSEQIPIDVHMNDKYVVSGMYANETKIKIKHLLEEDRGSYWCRAIFQLGESEERIELIVLSFLVPLKPFLAIVAEVALLVTIILLCEVYTRKKKEQGPDDGKEFEQIEQLKSDDSNGIENNAPRLRKNESVDQ